MATTRDTLRLARRLRDDVGTEADDAVRALTKAWVQAWDDLAAELHTAAQDLAVRQAELGRWPRAWELARIDRLRRALLLIEASLARLAAETGTAATAGAATAIRATPAAEAAILASQLPAAERAAATVSFDRLPAGAMDVLIRRATQQITAATLPLSHAATQAVQRELVRGATVGDSPDQTAQRIVDRVRGAFDGGLSRAIVIARTETLDAYRAASLAVHQANRDVLSGWRWMCDMGRRCCPSCWAQHGSLHPVDELGPADHQQGRCSRVPVVKPWSELGFGMKEPGDQFPDARKAFGRLPKADQVQIMGAERLALLRSGRVGWDDLSTRRDTPGWRTSYAPTPLKDLRARART